MIPALYEDKDTIVVQKPAGLESQVPRGFAPDMVGEICRCLHNPQDAHSCPQGASTAQPSYVGVIHRLDKLVEGTVIYGPNQESIVSLGASLQAGKMEKSHLVVVCGRPVDKQGTYAGYPCHRKESNTSEIVDKSGENDKKAVLSYRVLEVINNPGEQGQMLSLVGIELLTGRHHRIRIQSAGHATPLYGDGRYRGGLPTKSAVGTMDRARKRTGSGDRCQPLALCARRLALPHPSDGKRMEFIMVPSSGASVRLLDRARKLISAQERGKCHKKVRQSVSVCLKNSHKGYCLAVYSPYP